MSIVPARSGGCTSAMFRDFLRERRPSRSARALAAHAPAGARHAANQSCSTSKRAAAYGCRIELRRLKSA